MLYRFVSLHTERNPIIWNVACSSIQFFGLIHILDPTNCCASWDTDNNEGISPIIYLRPYRVRYINAEPASSATQYKAQENISKSESILFVYLVRKELQLSKKKKTFICVWKHWTLAQTMSWSGTAAFCGFLEWQPALSRGPIEACPSFWQIRSMMAIYHVQWFTHTTLSVTIRKAAIHLGRNYGKSINIWTGTFFTSTSSKQF